MVTARGIDRLPYRALGVRLVAALCCLAVAIGVLAAPAAASDRSLALTVREWALQVIPAGDALEKVDDTTTADQLIRRARKLQTVASKGAAAIATQTASTAKGTELKTLSQTAFADFAQAGRLLVSAVQDIKRNRSGGVDAKLKRATALAAEGQRLLERAGPLAKRLAR